MMNKKRRINKIAVLGSGVMGSRIACHFANIGCEVLLLDIPPKELNEKEIQNNLTFEDKEVKNRIVNQSLSNAVNSSPSPIYSMSFTSRIITGNFQDDLHAISGCDWIIEAVIEHLDIKNNVFAEVEKYRSSGTLITTNTSGIPIHSMLENRSEDFKKHFCGTHFFNPPRYLKLLEIIPSNSTDNDVIDFLMDYGKRFLGKTTILCKDTPAFIANRVGTYSILSLFKIIEELDLSVTEVDKLTGPVIGHPKSATFRTCDLVGIDTIAHVAEGLQKNCPDDEDNNLFKLPPYIKVMLKNNWLGSKSEQGFYKKVKNKDGKSEILSLNLHTLEYEPKSKSSFAALEIAKSVDNLPDRIKMLVKSKDKAGEFYRKSFAGLFRYVSNRVGEITDEIYKIDDAMKAGFGWESGPFELWDAIGVSKAISMMEELGISPAQWVKDFQQAGFESFYKVEKGKRKYYDIHAKDYNKIPGLENLLILNNLQDDKVIWSNSGTTIKDIGDGIINLEFHTKMNTIGSEIIQGINRAIDMAEEEYEGIVIYNEGANFSAGANIGMIFMMAVEQEFDELDFAIRSFQNTMMRIRYSSIPVIAAPHNLTLGGGCELCMHADKVVAHAETYMGLVEFGVGVIPAGGGTKEFALRLSDEFRSGDIRLNQFQNRFLTVGQAKVSTSAYEAFHLGYLRKGNDDIIVSRTHQLSHAKKACLDLAEKGYVKPIPRNDILVLGNEGLGIIYSGASTMETGQYISEHDKLISEKLGWVMCGGDLSQPTKVSEEYLLKMERKAFLELCSSRKTLERLESLIKTGKILRN